MDQWGSIGSDALVFYTAGGGVPKRYVKAQGYLITDTESALFDITLAPSPTCLRSGLLRPMVRPILVAHALQPSADRLHVQPVWLNFFRV
jgi:hypothetical protein